MSDILQQLQQTRLHNIQRYHYCNLQYNMSSTTQLIPSTHPVTHERNNNSNTSRPACSNNISNQSRHVHTQQQPRFPSQQYKKQDNTSIHVLFMISSVSDIHQTLAPSQSVSDHRLSKSFQPTTTTNSYVIHPTSAATSTRNSNSSHQPIPSRMQQQPRFPSQQSKIQRQRLYSSHRHMRQ